MVLVGSAPQGAPDGSDSATEIHESREILARAADRASAQNASGSMMRAVTTENRAAVRREAGDRKAA